MVRKTDNGLKIEQTSRSLDRVSGAENLIDPLMVCSVRFKVEQATLHLVEQLTAFHEKRLHCGVQVHGKAS